MTILFQTIDLPCIASQSTFSYLDPMIGTFESEVEILDFDEPTSSNQTYHDFKSFQRLGTRFWKPDNGVDGTLFRLPLRLTESKLSSVTYNEERIDALIERFKEEAHSTLIFLKHVQSIKVYTIERGSDVLEEVYSATLSKETQQKYTDTKANFVHQIDECVQEQDFSTLIGLSHLLEIIVQTDGDLTTFSYAVCEQYGYDGSNNEFIELMSDEELSYVPLVAVAYPINRDLDDGGHVFCTLPLPLHTRRMTGMPGINNFYYLFQLFIYECLRNVYGIRNFYHRNPSRGGIKLGTF